MYIRSPRTWNVCGSFSLSPKTNETNGSNSKRQRPCWNAGLLRTMILILIVIFNYWILLQTKELMKRLGIKVPVRFSRFITFYYTRKRCWYWFLLKKLFVYLKINCFSWPIMRSWWLLILSRRAISPSRGIPLVDWVTSFPKSKRRLFSCSRKGTCLKARRFLPLQKVTIDFRPICTPAKIVFLF